MATKQSRDRVGALVKEVEAVAKRLRLDIRKRAKASGLLKNLQSAADRLRKRAATAAAQVERYIHEIRKELEGATKPARRPAPKRRKRAAKPAVVVPPPAS